MSISDFASIQSLYSGEIASDDDGDDLKDSNETLLSNPLSDLTSKFDEERDALLRMLDGQSER